MHLLARSYFDVDYNPDLKSRQPALGALKKLVYFSAIRTIGAKFPE